MICSSCGRENRVGASFCSNCGARLERVCPRCGAPAGAGARFCDSCGLELSEASAREAPPETPAPLTYTPRHLAERILSGRGGIEGERRNVSVLYIDAADSTATGSRVDPEILHAVVRECTQRMVDAVHRYEGTVTQFRGDGIMALFGAPIAHEDSARRAVAAALSMRESLVTFAADLAASGRPAFRYRIGLNSGPVIVGRIADDLSMDYTAIGDTVNLAARMEQWARPDAIYVTENTYRQIRDYFEFKPLGPLEVKGKAESVDCFEVVRELPVRDRLDAALAGRGLSPFVGRTEELAALTSYFEHANRGEGQVVFVSGEAGMGKSRLLLEFRRSLEDQPVTWLEGHCSVYGETTAYLPLVELVKGAFGISEADSDSEMLARVESVVDGWEPAAREAAPYLKFLLNLDSGDTQIAAQDAAERRAGILDGLRALVLQMSRRGAPLVLAIEDLHWIDQQSQDAIGTLIDVIASAPVLMLLDFRPGYDPPFGHRSYFSQLSLASLSPEESSRISSAILEGATLPGDIRDLIAGRAEGNPFYVEEVTKSLFESGTLRWRDGSLVLTRPLDQVEIPDTIQGVILSRIDRLEQDERDLIQLASVIGREFTVRLLQRIADVKQQLGGLLSDLKALELIYEKAYFPEVAYMFKHALTHDVAYSTLLLERRRLLHRTVAQAIEELYSERLSEHYEMLAHHFFQAQEWDKALDYLVKAARKALDAYANAEALSLLDRALEALDSSSGGGTEKASVASEVHALRGRALTQAAKWAPAKQELEAALPGLPEIPPAIRLEALDNLSLASWWARDTAGLRRAAEELRALAGPAGRVDLVNVGNAWLASAYSADGDPLTSLARLVPVFEEADRIGVPMTSGPLSHFALWNYWTGRLDLAVTSGRELAQKARRANQVGVLMEALPHLAIALAANGHYGEAESVFQEARQIGNRYQMQPPLARTIAMQGGFHLDVLDFEGAESLANEARELAQAVSFPPAYVSAGIDLLLNFARRGEPERADELESEVGEAVEREAGWHGWLWKLRFADAQAELSAARGHWDAAMAHANDAIERSIATGRVKYQVAAVATRGRALMAMGKAEAGRDDLRQALELARPVGDPALLLRAAQALLQHERDEALAAEAVETKERIAAALPSEGMRARFLKSVEA